MASEWLKVMIEEIARKRDEQERARQEEARRAAEQTSAPPTRTKKHD
jgi:hypothetical protein